METRDILKNKIRASEEALADLYARKLPFSAHMLKWQDDALPDMYDHNCFELTGTPTEAEIESALEYQRRLGCGFLKLESDFMLSDDLIRRFGLDESCTLTMALTDRSVIKNWKRNDLVTVYDLKGRDISKDLLNLEIENYGTVYGLDFTRRKMDEYFKLTQSYEGFHMFGAYLGTEIAGSCYVFDFCGCSGLDGLIVSPEKRRMGVASTLMAEAFSRFSGSVPYLHADADDTPKDMYSAMGFEVVDKLYEYLLLF